MALHGETFRLGDSPECYPTMDALVAGARRRRSCIWRREVRVQA